MKLIDVIPLTKIPLPNLQILTYFTNKVNVKRGGLVMVTLGKRKIPAIVINSRLLEDEKMNIRKADFQLSPIKEVLSAKPIISPEQLELAFWIHEYYYEPLGLILKAMIPKNILSIFNFQFSIFNEFSISKFRRPELLQSNLKSSIDYFTKEIEKTLTEKRQILVLAPEINILEIVNKLLPCKPSMITSKTSQKKSREIWQKTATGKIKIIFGTRKALFLPFRDLGLIILTEEHNPHYKSWDQHPKYHTRETAAKLAELHNATLLMQSGTPSIETKFQISNFKFQKKSKFQISNFKIVDMRNEIKQGNYSIFSCELLEELKKAVAEKQKIILFINRRGEASAVLCRDCGHIIKCKNCEAPMVMHNVSSPEADASHRYGASKFQVPSSKTLICHHCNYKENAPDFCPNCHGHRIKFLGGGTEKVEQELRKIFPGQKISRLDSDTVKTEKAKKDIIKNFNKNDGVLIGTQLMASSDVSEADFLGIINSDAMLNMPDFRGGERIFQTIVSLLGKIKNSGKVIYQTYSPDHYAIKCALQNDYENFYKEELKLRKLFNYPPFSQIIKLTFSHKNQQIAEQEAKRLYEKLTIYKSQSAKNNKQKNTATHIQHTYKPENVSMLCVVGPAPAFIPRKKGKYSWHIILKINSKMQDTPHQSPWLGMGQTKYKILRLIPLNWEVDIDPESLL